MILTKYAPQAVKQSSVYKRLMRKRLQWKLRKEASTANPLKVMLGAGPYKHDGWLQTDKELLDVTSPDDWSVLFEPGSIDSLLSEHMLEHLSEDEARSALAECYRYLKPKGLFRLAVPDGYRRDPTYVKEVAPPADGHKMLYNIDSLTALLQSVGFGTTPLEYFDAQEQFHAVTWNEKDGMIMRSIRFDTQQAFQRDGLFYTSLIVDARKH
ncbi:MAG TPA: methyltransferase domain-containing protein [Pyrinomonadaceae bacterium]|nr:methyltransferase domain-containing protein [Pyrinomonadaceae bacterium]